MFDKPQKSVIYAPFASPADPFIAGQKKAYQFNYQYAQYEYAPSFSNLLRLTYRAFTMG